MLNLATLACVAGLMFLVQNFVNWLWGGDLRGYDFMTDPVRLGGAQFAGNKLLVFALALAFGNRLSRLGVFVLAHFGGVLVAERGVVNLDAVGVGVAVLDRRGMCGAEREQQPCNDCVESLLHERRPRS